MPRPFHEAEAHPRFGFMFGGMLVAVLSLAYAVSRMLRQRRARRVREDGASSPVLASAERLMLRYRADERIEDFVLLLSQEGLIPEGLERAAERILDGSAASDDIVRFLDAALSAMRRNGAAAERTL